MKTFAIIVTYFFQFSFCQDFQKHTNKLKPNRNNGRSQLFSFQQHRIATLYGRIDSSVLNIAARTSSMPASGAGWLPSKRCSITMADITGTLCISNLG